MSEKNPTVEELEKKLARIENTKGRMDILASLVQGYSQDIYSEYSVKISEAKSCCSFKNPAQKKDIEKIIAAIKHAIGDEYGLRHETVCKVADGNTLTFTLDYNYEKVPQVVAAKTEAKALKTAMESKEKQLSKWRRVMLMRIANGDDFTEFAPKSG